jgi:hypothetical protein
MPPPPPAAAAAAAAAAAWHTAVLPPVYPLVWAAALVLLQG